MHVCLEMVGRPLPSHARAARGREVHYVRFLEKRLFIASRPKRLCLVTQRVYTLPPLGESRGRALGAPVRSCRQELYQRRCRRPCWCASGGGLELQDVLAKRLQSADLGLDAGEGLRQVLL
jgi:hypothetical protein